MNTRFAGILSLFEDVWMLLLVVFLIPVVILLVGAPIALLGRALIGLVHRL